MKARLANLFWKVVLLLVVIGVIYAAFPSHPEAAAQKAMCGFKDTVYKPGKASQKTYNELYALYRELHDGFGVKGAKVDYFPVMKQLLEISRRAKT